MSASALKVYVAICIRLNEDGYCFPSKKILREDSGISTAKAMNSAVSELISLGVLLVTPRIRADGSSTSNTYTVLDVLDEKQFVVDELPVVQDTTTYSHGELVGSSVGHHYLGIQDTTPLTIYNNYIHRTIKDNYNPEAEPREDVKPPKKTHNPLGSQIIEAFAVKLDAKNKLYYSSNPQRSACDFLIEEYGLERCLKVIDFIAEYRSQIAYMPTITSPMQLREKWSALEQSVAREKKKREQANAPKIMMV
jgi:hypothetical protein